MRVLAAALLLWAAAALYFHIPRPTRVAVSRARTPRTDANT